jgi:pimeloyl-ACP methyl ester carboxylesterase
MRNTRIRHVVGFFIVVAALLTGTTYVYAATGRQLAESAISSLNSSAPTSTTRNVVTLDWSWFEVNYYDETYPLTVDVVGSNFQTVKKVIYLLPGGGVNFKSSFFTPIDNNIAQFLRTKGYLVIGITPREDNVPKGLNSYPMMAEWGMDKHVADIHNVIDKIQKKINNLPYVILGHSFGAAYALEYAGAYPDGAAKVIALDIYSFGPEDVFPDPYYATYFDTAAWLSSLYADTIASGQTADSTYSQIQSLMLISLIFPKIDSGESRTPFATGDFTYEGLLYFSMIDSAVLPGIFSDTTGLPSEWPMIGGYVSGNYVFSDNPINDQYSLNHANMFNLREASFKVGSGLVPYALYRDFFAINAVDGDSNIQWSRINKPVLWINTALGYGDYMHGVDMITSPVTPVIIGDYGHLDILASKTAKQDVWQKYITPFLN